MVGEFICVLQCHLYERKQTGTPQPHLFALVAKKKEKNK